MVFEQESINALAGAYPDRPVVVRHGLAEHPAFSLERLVALSRSLPAEQVEYNLGTLPIGQDPDETPTNNLSVEETIRSIESNKSWMAIKNVEADPVYADLMEGALADVAAAIGRATGEMYRKEAFIFVSSPGSVTPFHMDPEHNILLQVRGSKTMRLWPSDDPIIVPPQRHESFHHGGHRNLDYRDAFAERASVHAIGPGDALHVPLKAPHWVQNGDAVSVSFSITWRSEASDRQRRIHMLNARLRRLGLQPGPVGRAPGRETVKDVTEKVIERLF